MRIKKNTYLGLKRHPEVPFEPVVGGDGGSGDDGDESDASVLRSIGDRSPSHLSK